MAKRLIHFQGAASLRTWLLIAVLFGCVMFYVDQKFLANVAFLVAGALVAMITQLISESGKREERQRILARSLYVELANRVARCLYDFEKPWRKYVDGGGKIELMRLRRFTAVAPVIYPATAAEVSLLKGRAPQAIIRFYTRFEIFRTDMENLARFCELHSWSFAPPELVEKVAERLRRTLAPGLEALVELGEMVEGAEAIDAEAIGELDKMFKHEMSGQPLRKRLAHYAAEAAVAPNEEGQ